MATKRIPVPQENIEDSEDVDEGVNIESSDAGLEENIESLESGSAGSIEAIDGQGPRRNVESDEELDGAADIERGVP